MIIVLIIIIIKRWKRDNIMQFYMAKNLINNKDKKLKT